MLLALLRPLASPVLLALLLLQASLRLASPSSWSSSFRSSLVLLLRQALLLVPLPEPLVLARKQRLRKARLLVRVASSFESSVVV